MTGELSGKIMHTGFLRGAKSSVLLALASVADKHGQSWYAYASIATMARCNRKSAISSIKWLEVRGLVDVDRRRYLPTKSGKVTGAANLYTLNLDFFDALIKLVGIINDLTPGNGDAKRKAVKEAMAWVEEQVEILEWHSIVEMLNKGALTVRQICFGVPDATIDARLDRERQEAGAHLVIPNDDGGVN